MHQLKIKTYKIWYRVFWIIGLIGVIDVLTISMVQQTYHISDTGYISIGAFFLFQFLFGTNIASTLSVLLSTLSGFFFIWFILAYWINKKMRVIEKTSEEKIKSPVP